MVNYGGDEVAATVIDIGTATLRAGYAGDDTPKAVIPTYYGYTTTEGSNGDGDVTMGEAEGENAPPKSASKVNMFVGNYGPSVWRHGMEITHPVKNSMIEDFAAIPALITHAFRDVMRCEISDHPVLVTEPAWNTTANRERMAEIMFEEFNVPAFYIANTGVLNAFAAGKGSALVIDIGRSTASVTPVVDGFVLRKGLTHSGLPQLVEANAQHILTNPGANRPGIQLLPHQLISSKQAVEPGAAPRFTLREDRATGTTDTWRNWYESREVEDWVQSVGGVLDQGWNEQAAVTRGARHYEFPTGYNYYFGPERFNIGEQFFTHSASLASKNQNLPLPLPTLISTSLAACDQDLRQVLVGNVVLTGGGSLFSGLSDRLANELQRNFPHVKIHAPGNPSERRFGAWLGGSILASLGSFQQLWVSKEEWQEHGKAIISQRSPSPAL
ncbi:NuA4 histone acetyltransferase subunit [Steccherinum ochraceum]|uniref:NuA4 histone acetyltransferase subunit n=1 Tax=Steccherinum ochraceum TaxID=92696 RepID=A0A4R0RR14_9APHY|nr:NuA4 histone acetyltransferase subunit [Steccherinum ochraceum]